MQQTRVQARQLNVKGEGYHILLVELQKLKQANASHESSCWAGGAKLDHNFSVLRQDDIAAFHSLIFP